MLIITILLFAVAAVLGLLLITKVLKDRETTKSIVYSHGAAAAIGLVLLVISFINQGGTLLMASLILFAIAALGGFVLFVKDISGGKIPKWLAVVHALAAVTGFVLLLLAALGG